jgi:hypothetical protein
MTSRSTWGTKIINKDVIRMKIVNGMWKMGNAMDIVRKYMGITLPCSSHAPLHVFPKVYTKS